MNSSEKLLLINSNLTNLDNLILQAQKQIKTYSISDIISNTQIQNEIKQLVNNLVKNYDKTIDISFEKINMQDQEFSETMIRQAGSASKILALAIFSKMNNLAAEILLQKIKYPVHDQNINLFLAQRTSDLVNNYVSTNESNSLTSDIILNMKNYGDNQKILVNIGETAKKFIYAFPKISDENKVIDIYNMLIELRNVKDKFSDDQSLNHFTIIIFDIAQKIIYENINDNANENTNDALFEVFERVTELDSTTKEQDDIVINISISFYKLFSNNDWNKIEKIYGILSRGGNTPNTEKTKAIIASYIIQNYLIVNNKYEDAIKYYNEMIFSNLIESVNYHKIQVQVSLIKKYLSVNSVEKANDMLDDLKNYEGVSEDIKLQKSSGILEILKYYSDNNNLYEATRLYEYLMDMGIDEPFLSNVLNALSIIILKYADNGDYEVVNNLYNSINSYKQFPDLFIIKGKTAERLVAGMLEKKVHINTALDIFKSMKDLAEKNYCLDSFANMFDNFMYFINHQQDKNNVNFEILNNNIKSELIVAGSILINKLPEIQMFDSAMYILTQITHFTIQGSHIEQLTNASYNLIQALVDVSKTSDANLVYTLTKMISKQNVITEEHKKIVEKLADSYIQNNDYKKAENILGELRKR